MKVQHIEWSWGRGQHRLFDFFRAHLGNDLYMYCLYTPIGLLSWRVDYEE